MQALVNKYKDVEGDYESTMLGGIVHAYCDSGILTDALSVTDAERISTYFTEEGKNCGTLELFDEYLQEVDGEGLECCTAIEEMCAIIDDVETAAAYIGKLTDSLMEHCYTV
jgi:hypothetical protein